MIITKKIIENKGEINETIPKEAISFVFDELRDYCITRMLVNNIDELFVVLNNLKEKHLSPLEGVITYSYLHFRENKNYYDLCKLIIEKYITVRKLHYREIEENLDFGMNIIFEHGNPLLEFEKKYIFDVLNINGKYKLLWYFVINVLKMCKHKTASFHVIFEYLMTIKSFSCLVDIVNYILFNNTDKEHRISYRENIILENIKKEVSNDKSTNILFSIILGKYEFNVLDMKELNIILSESNCKEIKDNIKNTIELNK